MDEDEIRQAIDKTIELTNKALSEVRDLISDLEDDEDFDDEDTMSNLNDAEEKLNGVIDDLGAAKP